MVHIFQQTMLLKQSFYYYLSTAVADLTRTAFLSALLVLLKNECFGFSHAAAVSEFRFLTGHDSLHVCLFHFNLTVSFLCILCNSGQNMNIANLDVALHLKVWIVL